MSSSRCMDGTEPVPPLVERKRQAGSDRNNSKQFSSQATVASACLSGAICARDSARSSGSCAISSRSACHVERSRDISYYFSENEHATAVRPPCHPHVAIASAVLSGTPELRLRRERTLLTQVSISSPLVCPGANLPVQLGPLSCRAKPRHLWLFL